VSGWGFDRRLRVLANDLCRSGYRGLGILLEREGYQANHKKLFRIYREEGLAVRRRRFRVLCILDHCSREALATFVDRS
jgi:putative transposase